MHSYRSTLTFTIFRLSRVDIIHVFAVVIFSIQARSSPDSQECVPLWREEDESKPIGSEQQSSCHFLCVSDSGERSTLTLLQRRWHTDTPRYTKRNQESDQVSLRISRGLDMQPGALHRTMCICPALIHAWGITPMTPKHNCALR